MHEKGYTYTGPSSLYDLTWFEIFRLIDASEQVQNEMMGIRSGDLDKFERFEEKMRSSNGMG